VLRALCRRLRRAATFIAHLPGSNRLVPARVVVRANRKGRVMAGLAMVMFVALFAFGGQYFGWGDEHGNVQLALFSSFIFGIICGFKVRG
jgi:hypothetical protein